MSKKTPAKKRKILIGQGIRLNFDAAAAYFGVPAQFLRENWKPGRASLEDIEEWLQLPRTKQLLRTWEPKKKPKRAWIEGCTIRFMQRFRREKRRMKTLVQDCSISRKEDRIMVKSGNRVFYYNLDMPTLEIQLPFSSEFKPAREVFS